jgi:hypothetical protein
MELTNSQREGADRKVVSSDMSFYCNNLLPNYVDDIRLSIEDSLNKTNITYLLPNLNTNVWHVEYSPVKKLK